MLLVLLLVLLPLLLLLVLLFFFFFFQGVIGFTPAEVGAAKSASASKN